MGTADDLPVWRKICFAVGGAPYQTTNTVINFFISIFLLEVAEIPPYYVSVVLFGGKVWDAITDPICGYLVNKSNSRFGKFRPWIFFSAPFACAAYFCLWFVPDMTDEGKLAWYFVSYCFFEGLLSCLHVPYTSLTMAISGSQKERDSVTAFRMASEAVGVLLAVVVQGQLVNKYRKEKDCNTPTVSPASLDDQKWSYELGAIIVICLYLLCASTTFFGVKEKQVVAIEEDSNFFHGLRLVLTCKPYMLLAMAFLFLSLAIGIVQGNLALFTTHSLGLGDYFADFILTLLISAICSMPIWQLCLLKFGKKSTFATGMIILIPLLIVQLYVGDNMYVYYPILALAGLSISVSLLLPWSMLPDVLDEVYVRTGTRKDAIFYSFFVFFQKLALGIGLGVSQAVLALGGYESGACSQPESVGFALRLLVVPGPVLFVLIALVFLYLYPIDEERRNYNKTEILHRAERSVKTKGTSSHEGYLGPEGYNIGASASYESMTDVVDSTDM